MVNTPTDERLLADHLGGRSDAFEILVRRHAPELFRFIFRFTNSSAVAEDLVQETLLQVLQSAETFDPARRFKPWMFTIAANKARDWLRSRARRSELPLDAQIDRDHRAAEQSFLDLLQSDEDDHTARLERDEQRQAVRAIVDTMPATLREVLVLAYYHRFPYKQIAGILDIPVGTVKSRLHASVGHFAKAYRQAASDHTESPTDRNQRANTRPEAT